MDLVDFDEINKPTPKPTPVIAKPKPVPKGTLWRFYDQNKQLLYVSRKPNAAILTKTEWWADVDHVAIQHFYSVDALLDAQAVALDSENPKWNSQGRRQL